MTARGVYAITNVPSATAYYGQSEDMRERLTTHARALKFGQHRNRHLQASWDKYGPDAFVFAPLYSIPEGDLTAREKYCIDGAYGMGLKTFNICVAEPSKRTGVPHSAEACAKMSKAKLGNKSNLGRTLSAEHRANISASMCGNQYALGYQHTAATRAKNSAANRGRKKSAEHRAKIGAAHLGRKFSLETRARMSESAQRRGCQHSWSPVSRARLSASQRSRWCQRKQQEIQ